MISTCPAAGWGLRRDEPRDGAAGGDHLLPDAGDHERSTFPLLAKQRRLAGFPIEGYWRAIDTAKDIREAAKELGASGA